MHVGKLVFSQVMDLLPVRTLRQCVVRYRGDFKVKSFSCFDQYDCMAFAQLTYGNDNRKLTICDNRILTTPEYS